MKYRWSKKDKQDFHDNKLRAQSIPPKKFDGPDKDEWEDDDKDSDNIP